MGHVRQVGTACPAGALLGDDAVAQLVLTPPHGGEDVCHKEQNHDDEHQLQGAGLL